MYTIVSAYGVERTLSAKWKNFDISDFTPAQINNTFRSLYITLNKQGLPDNVSINIDSIMPEISWQDDTMENIFAAFGNQALEFVEVPQYDTASVIFGEAFRLGYTVNSAKPGSHYTSKALPGERTELQISRPDVNMENFAKQCVVTSNGYLYMHEYSDKIVYVPKAGYGLQHSKRNNVGFLSFEKIGNISLHRITPEMVSAPNGGKISDKCYVTLPDNIDLTNKSLLVVIAGHLYFIDAVCSFISDKIIKIRTELIPIMERFIASQKVIDYSAMGLNETSPELINIEQFYSNNAMKHYIGHEQSFFIVVDTPRLSYSKNFIKRLPLPGIFVTYSEPTAPLMVGHNRFAEYWKQYEGGEWFVKIADSYLGNRAFTSTPYFYDHVGVGPSNIPYRTYYDTQAYFLDIMADVEK